MPITTIESIRAGISRGWPISFSVPRVHTKANTTGANATRVNIKSKKNKRQSMATLKPIMSTIFVNVDDKSSPSLFEKNFGSNSFAV